MVRRGKWPRDIIKSMKDIYDLVIIGGGPAGLTGAIYARRANLYVLIIDYSQTSKLNKIANIENYPGYKSISGFELDQNFRKQVQDLDVEIKDEKVIEIKDHAVVTSNNEYEAKAILIATGSKQRKLDLPNALEYEGKGISYCATCDGFFFKNKPVVVIGDSSIAIEEAKYLSSLASKVTIISRNENKIDGIDTKTSCVPTSIVINEGKITGLTIQNINTKQSEDIECNGIFPYISFNPSTDFVDKTVLNDKGYIKTNPDMSTNIDGLFAAGDCIEKDLRQIVTAASDGAIAATSIIRYLKNKA